MMIDSNFDLRQSGFVRISASGLWDILLRDVNTPNSLFPRLVT
jgi:hypothetical protein